MILDDPEVDIKPLDLKTNAHAIAGVDPAFEKRLIEHIRPIADHYLATCLHHMFVTGIFEMLEEASPLSIVHISKSLKMDKTRLTGFLLYLSNEGIVQVRNAYVSLTEKGRQYGEFRAWYIIMIGGYGSTVQQMGDALYEGRPFCTRQGRYVGLGSCEMSRFDGIPITKTLLLRANLQCKEMLDLGCGNALCLVDFCRHMPELRAWGVEPDDDSYKEACRIIQKAGMQNKIRLHHGSTTEFFQDVPKECNPDLMVLGFVLHEILAQEGERAVIEFLKSVTARFEKINIIVIEVMNEIENPARMQQGLARNFWNPYYLIHYFTLQRLEKRHFWEFLFKSAELTMVDCITTDPNVDASGLEVGFLLRKN